jgi:hypothetical protein
MLVNHVNITDDMVRLAQAEVAVELAKLSALRRYLAYHPVTAQQPKVVKGRGVLRSLRHLSR